jgi:2-polyprenyl-3-methyl-5-hydroxy-6-metoxy-1,4-benzoquinol methylase
MTLPGPNASAPASDYPSITEQARFWDDHWQRWQERKVLNAWALRRNETILSIIRSLALVRPRLIDLGCGPGWFTDTLAEFGEVTGIDLSEEAIAMARRRNPHIRFIVGDLYRTPLPSGYFDVAVSQEVLGHVADQPGYLERAASLLRPGGFLLLATPNRFVLDRLGHTPWATYPPEHIDYHVSRRQLRALLQPWFEILRLTTIIPIGSGGLLRLVNSHKLNRVASLILTEPRLTALKERLGLGYQLVCLARKRTVPDRGGERP